MSERLEAWESREKLRTTIGWMAVYLWIAAALAFAAAISDALELLGVDLPWVGEPRALAVPLALLFGATMVWFGLGLWNARQWARWVVVALCGASVVEAAVGLVRGETPDLLVVLHAAIGIYLVLPSTGRHFARAQRLADMLPARR